MQKFMDILSKGAFLTTQAGGKANSMTISWGAAGIMWNKPVFVALVRATRFTHGLIEKSNEFTITLPSEDMSKALNICGVLSGAKTDKIAQAKLKLAPSEKIKPPRIDCKGTHYECKVLYKNNMSAENLDLSVKNKWYQDDDYHTFYYAEIVASHTI